MGPIASKESQSISEITRALEKLHGKAYYKNVYDAIQSLKKDGIISIKNAGRTSLVSLDFDNPETISLLSIIEIERKRSFLKENPYGLEIIRALESIGCLTILINARENIKLNLLEILFIRAAGSGNAIFSEVEEIGKKYNLRIVPLILSINEFKAILESRECNPIKDSLRDYVIMSNLERFWRIIEDARITNFDMLGEIEEINKCELSFNLERFGYSSFSNDKPEGRKINIETIIAACILKKDARLIEAIPVLLAKNDVNYNLLLYLAIKYNLTNMTGFLMETTARINKKQDIEEGLKLFDRYRNPTSDKTAGSIAKKWGVITRNRPNDFKRILSLYNAT